MAKLRSNPDLHRRHFTRNMVLPTRKRSIHLSRDFMGEFGLSGTRADKPPGGLQRSASPSRRSSGAEVLQIPAQSESPLDQRGDLRFLREAIALELP